VEYGGDMNRYLLMVGDVDGNLVVFRFMVSG